MRKLSNNEELASDIVQETFLKVWKNRHQLNPDKSFNSYLFQIGINIYRERGRKILRNPQQFSIDNLEEKGHQVEDEREAHEEILYKREMINFIKNKIEEFPEQERAIFIMKKVNDFSYKEISEITNDSERTIRRKVKKTIDTIVDAMEAKGYQKEGITLWALI